MKKYLLFARFSYSFSTLRPIQEEILKRGDQCAWYLDPDCANGLERDERQLKTIPEVLEYDPYATISAGSTIYDFFPGIKVCTFFGYPIAKKNARRDDHFTINGFFDIYCTAGNSTTPIFFKLMRKYGYFRVYETGWCKADTFTATTVKQTIPHFRPTILYASNFARGTSSANFMYKVIDRLAYLKPWDWIITLHPKISPDLVTKYEKMAEKHENVNFVAINRGAELYNRTDVLLCDTSSTILEYMMMNKPVVTYRNHTPGPHLIDVRDESQIDEAIEEALKRPPRLMSEIEKFLNFHEGHRDGRNSLHVLEAIDNYNLIYKGRLRKKPLNLIRKFLLRMRIKYYDFRSMWER